MKTLYNNKVAQYVLIICLSAAILFVQSFKLHMHIQHDDAPLSYVAEGHLVGLHVAFPPHKTTYINHHQVTTQDHHHPVEIDVSSSTFVKKMGLLNPFILLFFIISILICVTHTCRILRKHDSNAERPANYYLIQPPLRAPPC
ncbi:MAG: hypothetical protein DIZ80_07875 [endosymbiont of Galathealinum brachiosum]|uniref:Uncharacterized protein n=1 Tax=endosymbiont of Galathealinum brachiosum TaxID=2200906 RepID=A0A370DGT0_9GAMM|nr:MAG: hypothetical protein DIZ80_07875 [endosymbiont of Galathealinum brachiosum]